MKIFDLLGGIQDLASRVAELPVFHGLSRIARLLEGLLKDSSQRSVHVPAYRHGLSIHNDDQVYLVFIGHEAPLLATGTLLISGVYCEILP